jgi:hypothetical protein
MGAGPAAAVGGTWAGCAGGWPGCDAAAGGIPAGRAARPPPDDPRWGFLSCERLFFRDIRGAYAEWSLSRTWISA